ncbi:MAG: SLC13 family permease [Bacteroidaceae bacterium]|nr:SLC13 family permease [Prevotella sp.]MBP5770245.1 SLC13 family permease [Bacteroidaceae bacterium]
MQLTLIVLAVTALLFALNKVRSDIVALCALIALLVGGILSPAESLSGFSNPVVIMMAGLFIVGGGIVQTGLAKMVSSRLMTLAGQSELRLFLLVMMVTGFTGAFISNTGTVALMLPIVVSMANAAGVSPRRLLMPLAFASSLGIMTLISTPPNLVIDETLREAGYPALGFFSFLPVGLICLAVGIVVLLPLTRWLLKDKASEGDDSKHRGKSLSQLVHEYGIAESVSRAVVGKTSQVIGRSIAELDIRQRYGLTVLEVRRERSRIPSFVPVGDKFRDISQTVATPDVRLQEGDIIYLSGSEEQAARFAKDGGFTLSFEDSGLDFYDIGMAEIVLLRQSKFVGRQLSDSGFRSKYSINVLGVRRGTEYILDGLADLKMQPGDVLLVQGTWANIGRLSNDEEYWVVLGQPLAEAARVTFDYKAPLAALIMVAMVCMMVFDFIPVAPVTAVLIASVLMILTGCFRSVEAAYKTINWETIVLIAAMMPMSVALEKTGASDFVAQTLVGSLGNLGPVVLLAGIYFTTSLLTMFISNTATAVLMAPIALASAQSAGISPVPLLFAVAVSASMCFASPFSTPPNALVMKAGRYTFMDYVRVGLPLQLIMGIVMILVLPLLFPF